MDHPKYDTTPGESLITTGDQCADDAISAGKHPAEPPKDYKAKYPFTHYDEESPQEEIKDADVDY